MLSKPKLLCFFLSLCLTVMAHANKPYYFNKYQAEEGLSNNTVFCSLQDKRGFLWFGTKDGLNRFDGTAFKVFQNVPNNKNSLGNNYVKSLAEDKSGNLWIGTQRGLFHYTVSSESFELVLSTDALIRDVEVDKDGKIWFVSGSQLLRYDPLRKRTINYKNISSKSASAISMAADESLWIATASHLFKAAPNRSRFTAYNVLGKKPISLPNWIENIYVEGDDKIFVATAIGGLKLFDVKNRKMEDLITTSEDQTDIFVRCVVKKSRDEYWVGSESGVYVYDLKNKTYINLKKNPKNPYSLSDNAIYTMLVDKEGGVWVGTFSGGLNYHPRQYTPVEKILPGDDAQGISGSVVREIHQDRLGNYWIGTEDGGLNKFDRNTNRFKKFLPNGQPGSISYYNIHGLLVDSNYVWIGTYQHGLDVMDIKSEKVIKHYSAGSRAGQFKSNFIYTIVKTKSLGILLGTRSGLYRYNKKHDKFSLIKLIPGDTFIQSIVEDNSGTIWVGTNSRGLFFFDAESLVHGRLRCRLSNGQELVNSSINALYHSNNDQLWISTQSAGLVKYDLKKHTFKNVDVGDGLPSNTVYQVLEDEKRTLWVTTSKGLANIDPDALKIKVYTKAHGLLANQFNYSSGLKDRNGNIFLGSIKGLMILDPRKFTVDPFVPPVFITGFNVHNREATLNEHGSVLSESILQTDTISLNHNQATFNIDFAALSFTAPAMIKYAFKMEGLDKDWTHLTSNRKAYYTELPPGKYLFRVKASNSSGLWGSAERKLHIYINPPFWASTPAILLYVLLVIGGTILLIGYYHQRVKEKTRQKLERMELEKEKELYRAKITFFTDVAHEIRTPLTLIKGPMEKVMKNVHEIPSLKKNVETMARNTDRLMILTQQLLDFRKVENQAFTLNFLDVDVCALLKEICLNFNYSAEAKKMKLSTDLGPKHFMASIDPEAFTKMISNLLHNALKYGQNFLKVSFIAPNEHDTSFQVRIANGGPTVPELHRKRIFESFFRIEETSHQQGFGIGLALAKSLAELHNGTLSYEVSEDKANVFILTLPTRQIALIKNNAD